MLQLLSQAVQWSEEGICPRSWMEMVLLALLWGQRVSHLDTRPQVAATVKVLQVEVTGATTEFQAQPTAQHLPNILLLRQLIARLPLHIPRHHLSTLQHRRHTAQLHQPTVPRRQRTVLRLQHTAQRRRHTVRHHRHTVPHHRSIPRRLQRIAQPHQRTARRLQITRPLRLLTVLLHQRTVPPHPNIHRPLRHIAPHHRHTVRPLRSTVQQARHIAPQARPIPRPVRRTAQAQAKTETRISCAVEFVTTSFDATFSVVLVQETSI